MMDTIKRLQFRHHNEVFSTREDAILYIERNIRDNGVGMASEQNSPYSYSLFAEPTVLRYGSDEEPHIMLVIGADTNDTGYHENNKFCIIDIDKTEQEIEDLNEELQKAIASLTIVARNTDTLNLFSEKTESGTVVSGDVKVAESHIFDGVVKNDNLMVTPEGLFIYVNLEYDDETETLKFTVNNADGTLSVTEVVLPNNYLVNGYYDKTDESLHFVMDDGEEITVDCEDLLAEWGVEGENSKTPIVLTREEVGYGDVDEHHHLEPWQDVLWADVRLKDEEKDPITGKYTKDENSTNILDRTNDGRYLYVDGVASNIIYYKESEKTNVKEVLDELVKIGLSNDDDNILIDKVDGFFASAKLDYISSENTLVFKTSGQEDKSIKLNGVELFESVVYIASTETLRITYKDNNGQTQTVDIPIGQLLTDWEWEVDNNDHSVNLVKTRIVSGNDKLSADVKIFNGANNILEDNHHTLYVRGEADNIKYGNNSNVKTAIDDLISSDENILTTINEEVERAMAAEQTLNNNISDEINNRIADVDDEETRATNAEQALSDTIGTGFTSDQHENVTAKFNALSSHTDSIETSLNSEISRSTAKDTELSNQISTLDSKVDQEIADRIADVDAEESRATTVENTLQSEIDALSADSSTRLQDIINNDHSIDVDKTNATKPVIKVNLSTAIENDRKNIIKLNNDGLYVNVDLSYDDNSNKLIFHTSNATPDKEIQLESVSSIISMEYDPIKEAIIVTYLANGHEVKTIEIPVSGLIDEWRVDDGHNGAIQLEKIRSASGTSDQDILKASVVIAPKEGSTSDNILENVGEGALYVSSRGITQNASDIAALSGRMSTAESNIVAANNMITQEISDRAADVDAEENRAKAAENALDNKITQETYDRTANVNAEETRAKAVESSLSRDIDELGREQTRIEGKVDTETNRATTEESRLNNLISAETASRINEIERLEDEIDGITMTYGETSTVRMSESSNVVTANVKVPTNGNIIVIDEGIKADVNLTYDSGRNVLVFEKTVASGTARSELALNAGSIIDSISYDNDNKKLIITYEDAQGVLHNVEVGVADLFNEWIPVTNHLGAVKLTKTIGTGTGGADELSAEVVISTLPNNILVNDNGTLYAEGSGITKALSDIECAKGELNAFERGVLGFGIANCGENYQYEAPAATDFITNATNMNQALALLDKGISDASAYTKSVEDKVDELAKPLFGTESPTTKVAIETVDDNNYIKADVKLSYGKDESMTEEELTISGTTSEEFTNTNVLRVVNLQEEGMENTEENKFNGLYLSNVWDCGEYEDGEVVNPDYNN